VGLGKRPSREGLELLGSGVAQDSNRRLGTGRTKSLVPMECFVHLTVPFAQSFYLLHILVVFFRLGKELQQSRFEQIVRLRRF
jgi:hypothetical protein